MRPQTHYKKPKKAKSTIIATVRIVLTFAALAIFGMVFFFAWRDGWEAVFAWFGGKYFCMVIMILLFAITAALWLWKLIVSMKRLREDE